jgi:hypothetical protein
MWKPEPTRSANETKCDAICGIRDALCFHP